MQQARGGECVLVGWAREAHKRPSLWCAGRAERTAAEPGAGREEREGRRERDRSLCCVRSLCDLRCACCAICAVLTCRCRSSNHRHTAAAAATASATASAAAFASAHPRLGRATAAEAAAVRAGATTAAAAHTADDGPPRCRNQAAAAAAAVDAGWVAAATRHHPHRRGGAPCMQAVSVHACAVSASHATSTHPYSGCARPVGAPMTPDSWRPHGVLALSPAQQRKAQPFVTCHTDSWAGCASC
jgi:hypothetical protein